MQDESMKLDNFTVHYHNKEELLVIKKEIFSQHCYFTELETATPRIIDAGAHIGMASLYFKKQYPGAAITAIEPNPENFELLEKNIWENNLSDVTCIQKALAPEKGALELHTVPDWSSNTSLEKRGWDNRQQTEPITVQTIRLSSLLDQHIDILKLDIEGAELSVLEEAKHLLKHVKQIFVEYHATSSQSWQALTSLLKSHNFQLQYSKDGGTVRPHPGIGLLLIYGKNTATT